MECGETGATPPCSSNGSNGEGNIVMFKNNTTEWNKKSLIPLYIIIIIEIIILFDLEEILSCNISLCLSWHNSSMVE